MPTDTLDDTLTDQEAAAHLGLSPATVDRMGATGRLDRIYRDGRWRYVLASVEAELERFGGIRPRKERKPRSDRGMPRGPASYVMLDRLRDTRHQRGLTVRQLAELARTTHSTVVRIENGIQGALPSTLYRLADALGVTPASLTSQDALPPRPVVMLKEIDVLNGLSAETRRRANQVKENAPDLWAGVLTGELKINQAFSQLQDRRKAPSSA